MLKSPFQSFSGLISLGRMLRKVNFLKETSMEFSDELRQVHNAVFSCLDGFTSNLSS